VCATTRIRPAEVPCTAATVTVPGPVRVQAVAETLVTSKLPYTVPFEVGLATLPPP
jgi:hypothetical protein